MDKGAWRATVHGVTRVGHGLVTKLPPPVAQWIGIHLPMQETPETWVQFLDQEDPLEKEMATHSSILAWRIPGTEKPGGPQSMR